MFQPDNWGDQARFAMFIVASEAVPEAEWWAMLPPHMSVHAARVTAGAPWARWQADRSAILPEADLARGLEQFSAMRLSAVVVGHTSSSLLGGEGWDAAVIAWLSQHLPPDTFATTNGRDCHAALAASGVQRPFVVFPAWFNDATTAAGVRYFSADNLKLAGHLRFDPGPRWRDVATADMYPRGLGFEQALDPLYDQIVAACPASADGVLIAGTGFRCVGIIEALERALGRPVITANQASLWHCLRRSGHTATIPGYGNLFRL